MRTKGDICKTLLTFNNECTYVYIYIYMSRKSVQKTCDVSGARRTRMRVDVFFFHSLVLARV